MEGCQPCYGENEMRAVTEVQPSSSPPAEEDATPACKVLGNDDLVGEILDHVDSPTALVRAALASRRWLRRASDGAFLRRFRARHPPRLLGFFVSGDCMPRTEFVPMNAELTSAALRRAAGSVFDAFGPCKSHVWDSRDGRVLFDISEDYPTQLAVRDTLRDPLGAIAELPPMPAALGDCSQAQALLLPDDEDDDAACYRVDVRHAGRNVSAEVTVLRSGAWSLLCSAKADLDAPPERIPMNTLLAGGKVYMVPVARYIICVDLVAASLFAIGLPDGVSYEFYRNLVLSRGDDSVLYLVHVKGDELTVWLRQMDDDDQLAAGEWVLRDTVSIKETCGHLLVLESVVGVGDNAEFVFLEMAEGDNSFVVYLHLGSRKAEKVYQRDPDNDEIIEVYPFYMVWPPVFPAPDSDEELRHG